MKKAIFHEGVYYIVAIIMEVGHVCQKAIGFIKDSTKKNLERLAGTLCSICPN